VGFFKRLWGYIKTLFRTTAERAMDPEIEIEQAIQEARAQDQKLRNQAAKIIAHRTQIEAKIERSADEVGEAREMAKQSLMKAEAAKTAADMDGMQKWTRAAQSLAMKLQAAENTLGGFKEQYEIAVTQAESAKGAVEQNAMRLQESAVSSKPRCRRLSTRQWSRSARPWSSKLPVSKRSRRRSTSGWPMPRPGPNCARPLQKVPRPSSERPFRSLRPTPSWKS
jgi:phage shock protein A